MRLANSSATDPQPESSRRRRKRVRVVQMGALTIVTLGAAFAVFAERGTVRRGLHSLGHANVLLVLAEIAAEATSMVAFALVQHQILRAGGGRLSVGWVLSTAYAANAIAVGIPVVGSGMASGFAYQQFRKHGIGAELTSVVLSMAGVLSTVSFAAVALPGAILSGNPAALGGAVASALACVFVAALVVWAMRTGRGRGSIERGAVRFLSWSKRWLHRPRGDPAAIIPDFVERMARVRLGFGTLVLEFTWSLLNWLADALCLALAMRAVGVAVPLGPWGHPRGVVGRCRSRFL